MAKKRGVFNDVGGWLSELPEGMPQVEELPKKLLNEGWEPLGKKSGRGVTGGGARALHLQKKGGVDSRARLEERAEKMGVPLPALRRGKVAGGRRGKWEKDTLTKMLRKALAEDDGYWAKRVVNGLLVRASRGNPGCQKLLFDRCDGVLKAELEVKGDIGVTKEVVLTDLREVPVIPEIVLEAEVKRGEG